MTTVELVLFWAVAGAITVAVVAILLLALRRGAGDAGAADYDLRVYRDQLAEVDRDLARGIIAPADAERLRAEVSRRVLQADKALSAAPPARAARSGAAIAVTVAAMIAGAFGGYWWLGAPGYADMPLQLRKAEAETRRETRPDQASVEAARTASPPPAPSLEDAALLEQLRTAVQTYPDNIRGHELLARTEARLGNYAAAHAAQTRMIALKGDKATAADHANAAELMILATNGYVSPQAEAELTAALKADGTNGLARYYSGLMLAQIGRPDLAFNLWRGLLESSATTDPWVAPLRDQIGTLAQLAGVRYDLPPEIKGPAAADVAAAAQMSEADRTAMIENMVAGLNDELATRGGPPEKWAQLIRAYGVLGNTARAAEIYAEAKTTFAGQSAALSFLHEAAISAGLSE